MKASETAQDIDRAAADWVARADRGLTPEEAQALEDWLGGNPRRLGAYARMRAIFLSAGGVTASGIDRARPPSALRPPLASLSRRRWLAAGGGAIAAGLVGAVGLRLAGQDRRYSTAVGEVSFVPLDDGSVLALNTATVVEVLFTEGRRVVSLIRGEALFDVARELARPFIVEAGDAVVYAVGSTFTVSRLAAAPVEVIVRAGVVEVAHRGARADQSTRVKANSLAVAVESGPISTTPLEPSRVQRMLAWRDGRLAFEGETLAEAASQFARYSDTRIIIPDPSLAAETVAGLFQANDPVGFAQAIAASFDLRTEIREGEVRLLR